LIVASSGVASLLLSNRRTTHSRFRIPIDIDDFSICNIKRGTNIIELLVITDLIIWDEALVTNRQCLEALDTSLRDILSEKQPNAKDIPFGGKVVVLGGDPRQILPVIENVSKSACKELADFNNWILAIGNGTINHVCNNDKNQDPNSMFVEIPADLLICTTENKIKILVDFVYPDFQTNFKRPEYFKERAILATTNEIVDEINNYMLNLLPDSEKEYFIADTISRCTDTCNDAGILYLVEYLNTPNANNFQSHRLKLKVGASIMLLRNLNQSIGLCNSTRLIVTNLGHNVIQAIIITGTNTSDIAYIPRINLTTRGHHWPFTLCRLQFPIKVCYSMTINKSQGQTLAKVGVYLRKPVFTHRQLYVDVPRVTNKSGLKLLIENSDGTCATTTTNIVYKEILEMV
jgi:hypothetical protein